MANLPAASPGQDGDPNAPRDLFGVMPTPAFPHRRPRRTSAPGIPPPDVLAAARDRVLGIVAEAPQRFKTDLAFWLTNNWTIWLRFEREAGKVWAAGRRPPALLGPHDRGVHSPPDPAAASRR